jgi:hypothetical protein
MTFKEIPRGKLNKIIRCTFTELKQNCTDELKEMIPIDRYQVAQIRGTTANRDLLIINKKNLQFIDALESFYSFDKRQLFLGVDNTFFLTIPYRVIYAKKAVASIDSKEEKNAAVTAAPPATKETAVELKFSKEYKETIGLPTAEFPEPMAVGFLPAYLEIDRYDCKSGKCNYKIKQWLPVL